MPLPTFFFAALLGVIPAKEEKGAPFLNGQRRGRRKQRRAFRDKTCGQKRCFSFSAFLPKPEKASFRPQHPASCRLSLSSSSPEVGVKEHAVKKTRSKRQKHYSTLFAKEDALSLPPQSNNGNRRSACMRVYILYTPTRPLNGGFKSCVSFPFSSLRLAVFRLRHANDNKTSF